MANIEANRQLEERTLAFAVAVGRFVGSLPRSPAADGIGRQLPKSGTAMGSNCREANRAESREDLAHQTAIVPTEAAETDYRLEGCSRCELGDSVGRGVPAREARELLASFTTINRNAKRR